MLTAGHCVIFRQPEIFRVRAGSSNKNKGGQLIGVANIIVHEYIHIDESKNIFLHDVAVLRLKEIGPSAQTIVLAEYEPPYGVQALTTGWGKMANGNYPIMLQGANVPILSNSICMKVPGANEGCICAGLGDTGTCSGDSGGPLVVNELLVGVVSAGSSKCDGVSIYASVPVYHQWILNAIVNIF